MVANVFVSTQLDGLAALLIPLSAFAAMADGAPAIGIAISNVRGGNVVAMGEAVRARMDELTVDRPIGIEILPISDQSVSVKVSLNSFVMNVVVALAIVVGTLTVFMGLRSGILMDGILLVTVAVSPLADARHSPALSDRRAGGAAVCFNHCQFQPGATGLLSSVHPGAVRCRLFPAAGH